MLDRKGSGVFRLSYAYWSYLDAVNHQRGAYSRDWIDEVQALDRMIDQLTDDVWPGPGPVWLWITSDHGHQKIEELLPYRVLRQQMPDLLPVPWGTDRMLGLSLTDEEAQQVREVSGRLFGDRVKMIKTAELWETGWLGPGARPWYQSRLGNWILEPQGGAFWDTEELGTVSTRISSHGGRTPEELTIPWLEIRLD